ncbi:hypothetical protein AB3X94_08005 [Paraburkholderia sp. BR10923]|uniref:hypothetical protein n=1 Tax=Paraburkholderia sp. BR10923 TaxID=3236992 RepID=UPI0034CFF911
MSGGAYDDRLATLRAQLVAALEAEGYPALARDLTPGTRELAQRLFALDAMVRFTHHQPPQTPEDHATFYTAQFLFTSLMPKSTMTATGARHVRLCEEVLQVALAIDVTVEDAINVVADRHRGEHGAGAETIRRAYLKYHKTSPCWLLLEQRRKGV